jgi:imidazolonepropionase-like amidohydrolase/SAM-dependent methyltransferase
MDPKQIVADGYDQIAEAYPDWVARGGARLRRRYLSILTPDLPVGARVLDLGCGAGVPVASELAERFEVTGVDISRRQIELARASVPRATFIQADASALSFPDASFDAVVSFHMLGHLPRDEHGPLFRSIALWLRPGGMFVASTTTFWDYGTVEKDWLGAPMYFSGLSSDVGLGLMRAAGLEIVSAREETVDEDGKKVAFLWVVARKPAVDAGKPADDAGERTAVPLVAIAGQDAPEPTVLVIQDGTLIDGLGGSPLEHASVFIDGDQIVRVAQGDVGIPPGARVVDARGLTILPGLIDAHVHSGGVVKRRFLQFGVTTVRDLGTVPEEILAAREDERCGLLIGPRIVAAGPLLDGDPPAWGREWRGSVALGSVEECRTVARELIERDVDWLKVYRGLTPDMLGTNLDVAQQHGIPVAAHLGLTDAGTATRLGVRSIEHASGIDYFGLSDDDRASLIDLLVEHGTYLVPTLVVTERIGRLPTIGNAEFPDLDLVTERLRRRWLDWSHDRRFRAMDFETMQRTQAAKLRFVGQLYRAGGRIVAGSDTPNPFVIPGLSLHDELALLVSADLTPLDAIRSATSGAATMLGRSDLGAVEAGRLADLVLVAGNPADDIRATRDVRLVIKGGQIVHEQEAMAGT